MTVRYVCAACGSDPVETGGGQFACPHCDTPCERPYTQCQLCKAMDRHLGVGPGSGRRAG